MEMQQLSEEKEPASLSKGVTSSEIKGSEWKQSGGARGKGLDHVEESCFSCNPNTFPISQHYLVLLVSAGREVLTLLPPWAGWIQTDAFRNVSSVPKPIPDNCTG